MMKVEKEMKANPTSEGKNFKSLESSKVIIQKCLKNNNGASMTQFE